MWVKKFIKSPPENTMRLAHSALRISHKISGSSSDLRVSYFLFGTPHYWDNNGLYCELFTTVDYNNCKHHNDFDHILAPVSWRETH